MRSLALSSENKLGKDVVFTCEELSFGEGDETQSLEDVCEPRASQNPQKPFREGHEWTRQRASSLIVLDEEHATM